MSEKYHDAMLQRLDSIAGLGTNASSLAAAAQARQMPEINMPSPDWGAANTGGNAASGAAVGAGAGANRGGSFESFMKAISGQESGGSYGVRNKDSGAMGKYQIMPANLGGTKSGWDYEALGRDVSVSQFMGSPEIQEQVARHKLQGYYNKYGAAGAAVAWYAGPGAVAAYNRQSAGSAKKQGNYPSINAYVASILKRMG